MVEIAGPEGITKAETLAEKLRKVLGEQAVVARPTIKGELRLIGLDDSTTEEEVKEVLAEAGGCQVGEIRTGPLQTNEEWTWHRLGPVSPYGLITRIHTRTVARVEVLRNRPLQCFKCWAYGHVKSCCQEEKDRSNTYYRCGMEGHNARNCTRSPSCVICNEKGLNGQHRMGSQVCSMANPKAREAQYGRRTRILISNGSHNNPVQSEQ